MATWYIRRGRRAVCLPALKWVLCRGESDTEITQWVTPATGMFTPRDAAAGINSLAQLTDRLHWFLRWNHVWGSRSHECKGDRSGAAPSKVSREFIPVVLKGTWTGQIIYNWMIKQNMQKYVSKLIISYQNTHFKLHILLSEAPVHLVVHHLVYKKSESPQKHLQMWFQLITDYYSCW